MLLSSAQPEIEKKKKKNNVERSVLYIDFHIHPACPGSYNFLIGAGYVHAQRRVELWSQVFTAPGNKKWPTLAC